MKDKYVDFVNGISKILGLGRPVDCKSVHSGCAFDCKIKNKWQTYKLGEAINPKYAYRK